MKKVLTLTVALLALSATLAMANSGIGLYVGDCGSTNGDAVNGMGTGAATFTVPNTNVGTINVYCTIVSPYNVNQLVACEAIIDLQSSTSSIPAWWQLGTGCRAGKANFDFSRAGTGAGTCASVWGASSNDPTAVSQIVEGAAGRERFQAVGAVPAAVVLSADNYEHVLFLLNVTQALTKGAGACAGFGTPVYLMCNQIKLDEPAGVGDYTLNGPSDGSSCCSFGGTAPPCYGATPTQNKTWGAVKAMYR